MSFNATELSSVTTADEYGAGAIIDKRSTKSGMIAVRNTGGKDCKFKIEGSVDGTNFVELIAEATLATTASTHQAITDYWPYLKVSAKSKESGKPTTVKFDFAGIDA